MMQRRSAAEVRELVCNRRWQRKHLLSLQKQFGDEHLFDALYSSFTDLPEHRYFDQLVCGQYLLELHPSCPLPLKQAIRNSLANWNLSVPQLPQYFCEVFGRQAVLESLAEIETEGSLSETESQAIITYRYWLHAA